jgi:hypothetical protein
VHESLFKEMLEQFQKNNIRVHTNRLCVLAKSFVLALLAVSDDGKILTARNIEIAKHTLLNKGKCDYE